MRRPWINVTKVKPKADQWYIGVRVWKERDEVSGDERRVVGMQKGFPGTPLDPQVTFWTPLPDPTLLPAAEGVERAKP